MNLFVVGATGGTGREIVDQALARGHRVTAFVRSPQRLGPPRERLRVVPGDPLSTDAIGAALSGHDAVLSAIGPRTRGKTAVVQDGARAIATAMKAIGLRRLVVVSVGLLFTDAGLVGALLRNTFLRGVADDSEAMERMVRASDLDWTIVRPPRLTHGPRTESYAVSDGRLPNGVGGTASIARSDLAHFLLDEVERGGHLRQVVGVARTRSARRPERATT